MRNLVLAAMFTFHIVPALAQSADGNLQEADRYLESLKSRDVFRSGTKIGEINDVLIDVNSRQLVAVVVKYDPAGLNLRDRHVIVRFDQIEISPTYPRGASVELTDEQLKALPEWHAGEASKR
jgi:sporulation protein YlmC with PRC-barrel domain